MSWWNVARQWHVMFFKLETVCRTASLHSNCSVNILSDSVTFSDPRFNFSQSLPFILQIMKWWEWRWRSLDVRSSPCRVRNVGTHDVSWGIWTYPVVKGIWKSVCPYTCSSRRTCSSRHFRNSASRCRGRPIIIFRSQDLLVIGIAKTDILTDFSWNGGTLLKYWRFFEYRNKISNTSGYRAFKDSSINGSLHMAFQYGGFIAILHVLGVTVRSASWKIFSAQGHGQCEGWDGHDPDMERRDVPKYWWRTQ